MMQLEEVFNRQTAALRTEPEEVDLHADAIFLLCFHVGETRFASPIDRVREVVENAVLTRLPIHHPAFLGVINLRGNLIPVLSPEKLSSAPREDSPAHHEPEDRRFMIFETESREPFAVEARKVCKVLCPESELREMGDSFQEVLRIEGEPTHLLNFFSSEAKKLLTDSGDEL